MATDALPARLPQHNPPQHNPPQPNPTRRNRTQAVVPDPEGARNPIKETRFPRPT